MTAIAWSLVVLMAASLGVLSTALFSGLGRIDALGARIDSRIDAKGARLDARIDSLGIELRGEIREVRHAVLSLDVRLTSAGG